MIEFLSKESLKNLRERIFKQVKEMAARRLLVDSAGNSANNAEADDMHEVIRPPNSHIDQWEPVPRRAIHNYANDVFEYLLFVTGRITRVPIRLICTRSLENGTLSELGDIESLVDLFGKDVASAEGCIEVDIVSTSKS